MVAKRGCTVLAPFSCPAPCTYYLVRAEVETVVWVFCRESKGTQNVHRNCKFGIRLLGTAGVSVLNSCVAYLLDGESPRKETE